MTKASEARIEKTRRLAIEAAAPALYPQAVANLASIALLLAEDCSRAEDALEDMVWQFAHRSISDGRRFLATGGLSALESAFAALGWSDPHFPEESNGCDEPGCNHWATCGTPTPSGYMRLCSDHFRLYK